MLGELPAGKKSDKGEGFLKGGMDGDLLKEILHQCRGGGIYRNRRAKLRACPSLRRPI